MIESYQAYGDWRDGMELTRGLVQEAANSIFGSTVVKHFDGRESNLGGAWQEISLFDSVSKALGEEIAPHTSYEKLVEYAKKVGLSVDPKWIHGKLVEELFEHLVIETFTGPTFVTGYPVDTSPLVRSHRELPGVVEKWDLYVDGFELATGYSELVDPVIQRERLVAQAQLGAKGDLEAMALDEDFLRALEVGMPPTAGMGMGVDRLLMALTGLGIRETILFPLVKPE
jgi:lysyl-tRNA synthetase class 2